VNPSSVHSKRFLIHEADYKVLKEQFHETEHLIEFLLADGRFQYVGKLTGR
jgi:putative ABC transport system permease protein